MNSQGLQLHAEAYENAKFLPSEVLVLDWKNAGRVICEGESYEVPSTIVHGLESTTRRAIHNGRLIGGEFIPNHELPDEQFVVGYRVNEEVQGQKVGTVSWANSAGEVFEARPGDYICISNNTGERFLLPRATALDVMKPGPREAARAAA